MASMPNREDRDRERMHALLRAAEVPAPDALHRRIADVVAEAPRPRAFALPRLSRPLPALAGALAAAVLAVVLALSLGGSAQHPTALGAVRFALARATAPAGTAITA